MVNINYEEESSVSELVLTEDESDSLINNLKDELILESILEQIENPLNNNFGKTNYLEIFETRYNYLSNIYRESTDFIRKLNEVKSNIYSELFLSITKKYELSYSDDSLDIVECASDLYNFFVLDFKDNIVNYFVYSINNDKKSIYASINSKYDGKYGINVKALKKVLKNKEDAVIISNIPIIIDEIINQKLDNLKIIEDITEYDIAESTNYKINQYFIKDFTISPSKNFTELFFSCLKKKIAGYSNIVTDIKMELFRQAPKKS